MARIITDTPMRDLWNRIAILSTEQGAKRLLESKKNDLERRKEMSSSLIDEKTQGITFCINNAREYFSLRRPEQNVTSSALLYYYGTFALFSALLLSDLANDITLKEIEDSTKYGAHGIGNVSTSGCSSPYATFIYLRGQGFLNMFLKNEQVVVDDLVLDHKPRLDKIKKEDETKLISFKDLLGRIPEIRPFYDEICDFSPYYFIAGNVQYKEEGNTVFFPYIDNSKHLNIEMLSELFSSVKKEDFIESPEPKGIFLKSVEKADKLRQEIEEFVYYESPMSKGMKIKPLKKFIKDPLVFHFMALYMISIFARYQVHLWRNMISGVNDEFKALITFYLRVVERIIPNLVLNRLYGEKFVFAPFSYLS